MWTETPVFREDLERLASCTVVPWERFVGKTVFVTGATGLIGYTLASALLYYSRTRKADITVAALVRDLPRAREKFSGSIAEGCGPVLIQGSVEQPLEMNTPVDYIVHGACPTESAYFVAHPVETLETILTGTKRMLELAKTKQVSGMVYLSSMEVYGETEGRGKLRENDLGKIDLTLPRSSYPEGKRMAEALCTAYAAQYQTPVTAARLAQTFGPGVNRDDGRVFAYVSRCALNGEDILLKTSGGKENMYLYTADAVSALLLLLAEGPRGRACNIANSRTFCSVKELAQIATDTLGNGQTAVRTNVGGEEGIYRPGSCLNLDVSALEAFGWRPTMELPQMFRRMAACF